jgi:hypothetical protein
VVLKKIHLNHPKLSSDAVKKLRNLYFFPSRVSDKTAPVRCWAIWSRQNGARAARDIPLQPITSIAQPLFNFAHCPNSQFGGILLDLPGLASISR